MGTTKKPAAKKVEKDNSVPFDGSVSVIVRVEGQADQIVWKGAVGHYAQPDQKATIELKVE